jgi:LysR family nitrogen assimilation transcriptional regulator
MILTDSGLTFYDYSIDILKLMEKALIKVKSNTKELTGSFNCGLMPTFTRSALPNTLTQFLTDNPKVDIKITEAYSGVLEEMVRSNKLEFAIVPSVKNPIGLNVEFISSDINLLVTSKNSLFKHLEPINLSSVKNIKIILPGPENSRRVAINEYFATHNINVIKKLEMDGMIGTLQMIATSDWSAILPAALCHLDLSGETRTLSPLISPNLITDYVMITSASKELSPVAELFSKKICKEIKNLSKNFNEKAKLIN